MEPSCCSSCRRVAIVFAVHLLLLRLPSTWSLGLGPEPAPAPPAVSRTITVDQQGGGDFTSVQSAVNFVPDGNREWVRIHVKSGSYRYVQCCFLARVNSVYRTNRNFLLLNLSATSILKNSKIIFTSLKEIWIYLDKLNDVSDELAKSHFKYFVF